ncbi:MAG: hypothetical protein M1826_006124 [Phylliscum demangeonii]|nr:MAG: hypothetical protein M1826_006124 [Phylliscum demangeonii]
MAMTWRERRLKMTEDGFMPPPEPWEIEGVDEKAKELATYIEEHDGHCPPDRIRPLLDPVKRIASLEAKLESGVYTEEMKVNIRATIDLYRDGTLKGELGTYYIQDGKMTAFDQLNLPGVHWCESVHLQATQVAVPPLPALEAPGPATAPDEEGSSTSPARQSAEPALAHQQLLQKAAFPEHRNGYHYMRIQVRLNTNMGGDGRFVEYSVLNDTGSTILSIYGPELQYLLSTVYAAYNGFGRTNVSTADGTTHEHITALVQVKIMLNDIDEFSDWIDDMAMVCPADKLRLSGLGIRSALYFGTAPGNHHLYVSETKNGLVSQLPVLRYSGGGGGGGGGGGSGGEGGAGGSMGGPRAGLPDVAVSGPAAIPNAFAVSSAKLVPGAFPNFNPWTRPGLPVPQSAVPPAAPPQLDDVDPGWYPNIPLVSAVDFAASPRAIIGGGFIAGAGPIPGLFHPSIYPPAAAAAAAAAAPAAAAGGFLPDAPVPDASYDPNPASGPSGPAPAMPPPNFGPAGQFSAGQFPHTASASRPSSAAAANTIATTTTTATATTTATTTATATTTTIASTATGTGAAPGELGPPAADDPAAPFIRSPPPAPLSPRHSSSSDDSDDLF